MSSLQGEVLEIVYQNSDFVLVNKPCGLNFHTVEDASGVKQPGLVVLVKQQLACEELYPVHRLDKMTSGLVLFALNKATAQAFNVLFSQHLIQKYYLAISDKKPKKKQGWIKGDMLLARRGSYKLAATQENPAKTQFISQLIEPGLRLYLVKPITGKTHQIRVALKSIGAPILGDGRYHEANAAKLIDRGYLHAYAIDFELRGHSYQFVLPPSEGAFFLKTACQTIVRAWAEPWTVL